MIEKQKIYLVRITRKDSNLDFSETGRLFNRRASNIVHECRSKTYFAINIFFKDFGMHKLDVSLHDTDLRKSPGPDKILNCMIDHLGRDAPRRRLDIINISWSSGRLSRVNIIPIRKPQKDARFPESYRHIALISVACDRALPWIYDFMRDRTIRVQLNDSMSRGFKLNHYNAGNRISAFLKCWSNNQGLKKNSPFRQVNNENLIFNSVEPHHLYSCIDPSVGLSGVIFYPTLSAHVHKTSDLPEYLWQLVLELINSNIPDYVILVYRDVSQNEMSYSGRGI
ncbi:uncharacterized protein NPIL_376411 [Nephila pilipes]|uniref:Uncharacterized protein n=1 Tax=Nephila pilipes TaxID=299642 RepID=A0A8X6NWM1_NEPPI|nr:uncharacterized protein NPIL_376411 [Nephila pilipes]